MKYNDFKNDLEYSLNSREDKLFDRFYHRIFPNLEKIEIISNLKEQLEGIDKKLHFKNGKIVTIDEKKRRKDYGDILIEEYSNLEKKKVGWMNRHKKCDYIIYAIMPAKKVYLLPFLILQKVWVEHYKDLKKTYKTIKAQNIGYTTTSIAIPIKILMGLIKSHMQEEF